MENLLVVDGNSILNRAFYGIRPLSTKDGIPTNAVYGFITILKKHMDALKPDYAVCAFDMHAPTFRHKYYEGYKATRHATPEDLLLQMPWAHRVAEALGFCVIELEGYEADDIIGTVCDAADCKGDIHSFALTGDRDSLQLITDRTSVILVKTKEDIIYTPEKFTEEYGVTPHEYIDVKALMGDSSDNIPGVKGIGEKTAFKLIAENKSLEGVFGGLDNLSVGRSAKEKLAAGKDDAFSSRYLATIIKDCPIGKTVEELKTDGIKKRELSDLFLRLEFSGLYRKFDFDNDKEETPTDAFSAPEFTLSDGDEKLGDTVFAYAHGDMLYLSDGENNIVLPITKGKEIISSKKVICHGYKELLRKTGTDFECVFDTLLAAYLLDSSAASYSLDKLLFGYLKLSCETIEGNIGCYALSLLYPVLSKKLKEAGSDEILQSIEIPLSKVLYGMEEYGMMLDAEGLEDYGKELSAARDITAERVYSAAGHKFNINSPKQLATVLFEEMGLPVVKKTKSGYSTNSEVLETLKYHSPIVSDVLEYRRLAKLISTYTDVLPTLTDSKSRIHTSLNQTGTATGRLSSSEPNLQNIPVRGELGKEIRKYFVAGEGNVLIDADYSQIELRVLANLSDDSNMKEAFLSGKDIHTATASQVFGVSELMVDSELRRRAKAVNFGIVYGIGAFSLSQDLGISRKQADDYIESYLATYPSVDKYLKDTVERAKEDGYTLTYFGRKRLIPELSASNRNLRAFGERVAMNSPIQGTAADIIKIAMINVSKALADAGLNARLIMQVHDELIVESSVEDAEKACEILKHEMESTADFEVPLTSEAGIGSNWLEAKG